MSAPRQKSGKALMPAVCSSCNVENPDGSQFCGACGGALLKTAAGPPLAPPPAGLGAIEPPAGAETGDDPQHVELWREALESFYIDGELDADERLRLAQIRSELRARPATLDAIEREVQHQFRPRVAVKVQSGALAGVRAGAHVSVVVLIENIDAEGYEDAWCELLVDQLRYQRSEPLGRWRRFSKERRTFTFKVDEPGAIHAELRVVLIPREGLPIVARSRGGDLAFQVDAAPAAGSAVVYNIHSERIVGDIGTDKGITVGGATPAPQQRPGEEWRTLVLEIAPQLIEAVAAQRDAQRRKRVVERPARYRAAELCISSGSQQRRVTLVAGAVITAGRNATTPSAQYRCNDVKLRVEPTSDPRCAAATQQISGHAHFTVRCDGRQVHLIDNSTHGTIAGGQALSRGSSARLDDRTEIAVAGVLRLLAEVFRGTLRDDPTGPPALDLPSEILDARLVGVDQPGQVDAIRLRRGDNLATELEHVILIRQARIGSSPYDCIQVRGAGVCERHARLLVDRGQFWIELLSSEGALRLNSEALEVGQRVGLVPGDVLELGDARVLFAPPAA